jgi:hypothetical protein
MQALSSYFSDFFIQLDEPAREYFPGEEVRGIYLPYKYYSLEEKKTFNNPFFVLTFYRSHHRTKF